MPNRPSRRRNPRALAPVASTYRYVDSILVVGGIWFKMPLPGAYDELVR